jgi:hypothetical protein
MLRGIGAMNRNGGALTSYLLFERPYTMASDRTRVRGHLGAAGRSVPLS